MKTDQIFKLLEGLSKITHTPPPHYLQPYPVSLTLQPGAACKLILLAATHLLSVCFYLKKNKRYIYG